MSKELDHFRGRTDAKLEYAELTLQELRAYERRGSGDNFERAHHEAFLFHLLGAENALLQELDVRYSCALRLKNAALDELDALHRNDASWLSEAKSYRNHSTHRQHIPRAFFAGGDNESMVRFRKPETGQQMGTDVLDAFADWVKSMGQLIEKGRR